MKTVEELLQSPESVRWLFYGDSCTHGALHTFGRRDFTEHFREHIIWEYGRKNDLVLNTAHSGYTCRELIEDFDFRAAFFKPHAAFVLIGTNDCTKYSTKVFAENLKILKGKFDALDTCLILQTSIPPVTELNPQRAGAEEYAAVLRTFAEENGIDLIDHWKLWNALSMQDRFYLLSDPLHPNGNGHLKMAQDIFRYMNIFMPEKPVCRMQPGPVM